MCVCVCLCVCVCVLVMRNIMRMEERWCTTLVFGRDPLPHHSMGEGGNKSSYCFCTSLY